MKYEFLEHTADIKFKAYGSNLEECFENAALAFSETITDTSKVKPSIKKEFKIKSEDKKALLYDFLEELLIIHETENFLFNKFKIRIQDNTLTAAVWGEKLKNHETRNLVKAITYSEMIISDKEIQVVLDI